MPACCDRPDPVAMGDGSWYCLSCHQPLPDVDWPSAPEYIAQGDTKGVNVTNAIDAKRWPMTERSRTDENTFRRIEQTDDGYRLYGIRKALALRIAEHLHQRNAAMARKTLRGREQADGHRQALASLRIVARETRR